MKLAEHVDLIRGIIDKSFRNRFGRMGIMPDSLRPQDSIPQYNVSDRNRIKSILKAFVDETGSDTSAYEKLVDEFTFTLFNRLAAMKVMETHALKPEIIARRSQHGNRSFAQTGYYFLSRVDLNFLQKIFRYSACNIHIICCQPLLSLII